MRDHREFYDALQDVAHRHGYNAGAEVERVPDCSDTYILELIARDQAKREVWTRRVTVRGPVLRKAATSLFRGSRSALERLCDPARSTLDDAWEVKSW